MSLNYTHPHKNKSELWGDPRLGKSGIRICSDLCHYPNNSTRPWNLKSKWNPYHICSASTKPEVENIMILEHMTRVVCQLLPLPLCQRAELAAVPEGRAPSCSADLTSLCLVPPWKEHCVHGKGILKMKLMQSTSQAIFIARHPFRYPIMSAAWQISPELSCFRWLSFKILV